MAANDLCFTPATQLVERMKAKEVSAVEVMEAHLAQIERCNPEINAVVTQIPREKAMALARQADDTLAKGQDLGPLHGLPVAHKDLVPTKGIRTTYGSPLHKNLVPTENALLVDRLQGAGALTIGKTNTPEFGAGAQTFNKVFGATKNPYNLNKTCGGSSGGAAASLAAGMLPLADGSDTGGSLRNPASFCNVIGFRVSPGRCPAYPSPLGWWGISTEGPMARTVEDCALMLSVMAGPDVRSPIAIQEKGDVFRRPLGRDFKGVRGAWAPDFGGKLVMEKRVRDVLEGQRGVFKDLGLELDDAAPDFSDADEIFQAWRAWRFELRFGPLLEKQRDQFKDTIIWNTEKGMKLTGPELGRAEMKRTLLYHQMCKFLEKREFFICTTNQVAAFDVNQPYVTEIDGQQMETYIDWMRSCWWLTITGLPAISIPCGFTPEGLPVGIQIVGRHQSEFSVLQLAYAFEQATKTWMRRPEGAA